MNPVIKIINQVIIITNKIIDSIDKKTTETIKNSFYFIIFILIIVGVFIGYKSGKRAAKIYGKPLTETTNSIFDVKIKRESAAGRFQSMLDTELMEERRQLNLKKIELPVNEKQLKPEFDQKIIESDNTAKEPSMHLESGKIADIDRIDQKIKSSDVRELRKEKSLLKKNDPEKSSLPIDKDLKIIEK